MSSSFKIFIGYIPSKVFKEIKWMFIKYIPNGFYVLEYINFNSQRKINTPPNPFQSCYLMGVGMSVGVGQRTFPFRIEAMTSLLSRNKAADGSMISVKSIIYVQ